MPMFYGRKVPLETKSLHALAGRFMSQIITHCCESSIAATRFNPIAGGAEFKFNLRCFVLASEISTSLRLGIYLDVRGKLLQL